MSLGGDLLSGPNNTYIATLVERHTRYVMLAKVAGKDTETVVTALIKQAKKLPKELYKSLTWDRGKELTDHRRFTLASTKRTSHPPPLMSVVGDPQRTSEQQLVLLKG